MTKNLLALDAVRQAPKQIDAGETKFFAQKCVHTKVVKILTLNWLSLTT